MHKILIIAEPDNQELIDAVIMQLKSAGHKDEELLVVAPFELSKNREAIKDFGYDDFKKPIPIVPVREFDVSDVVEMKEPYFNEHKNYINGGKKLPKKKDNDYTCFYCYYYCPTY